MSTSRVSGRHTSDIFPRLGTPQIYTNAKKEQTSMHQACSNNDDRLYDSAYHKQR